MSRAGEYTRDLRYSRRLSRATQLRDAIRLPYLSHLPMADGAPGRPAGDHPSLSSYSIALPQRASMPASARWSGGRARAKVSALMKEHRYAEAVPRLRTTLEHLRSTGHRG